MTIETNQGEGCEALCEQLIAGPVRNNDLTCQGYEAGAPGAFMDSSHLRAQGSCQEA